MAAPFGFSAGDFVAGLHLLHKAVVALRGSDGADAHFQNTILELEGLQFILQRVQRLQLTSTKSDIATKLQFLAHQCYIPIDTFLTRIRKLVPELGEQVCTKDRTSFQKYGKRPFRQVQWGVQLKKHVVELKTAIGPHLAAIEILLQLASLEQQRDLIDGRDGHDAFAVSARELSTTIQTCNDNLTSKLDGLSTAASVTVTNKSLAGLHDKVTDLNEQVMSRLDEMQFSFAIHQPVHGLRCQDTQDDREAFDTLRHASPNQHKLNNCKLIVSSKKTAMDKTIREVVELLREGVTTLILRLWLFLSLLQNVFKCLDIARLPSMLLSSNIRFEDALGRLVSLPYEDFKHLPVFLARLQLKFNDTPGRQKVALDQFHILHPASGALIRTEDDWHVFVKPGAKLQMSIVFEQVRYEEIWYAEQACPRCKASSRAKRRLMGRINCTQCGFGYHQQDHGAAPSWSKLSSITNSLMTRHGNESASLPQRDMIRVYKNVHVVKTCNNPDCFTQVSATWGSDSNGHLLCAACDGSTRRHGMARPQDIDPFFDPEEELDTMTGPSVNTSVNTPDSPSEDSIDYDYYPGPVLTDPSGISGRLPSMGHHEFSRSESVDYTGTWCDDLLVHSESSASTDIAPSSPPTTGPLTDVEEAGGEVHGQGTAAFHRSNGEKFLRLV